MLKNFYYNCNKLGNIKYLEYKESNRVYLKKNFVRIQVHAIGLNYVDILMIKGRYQYKKNAPFIPGIEASGIIIDQNCNNKDLLNKKVIVHQKEGCFSEEMDVILENIILIPKKIDCALAAGSYISTLTNYIALIEIGRLKKNDNILISGASGGLGVAAIKMAKSIGSKVISVVSDNRKKKFVKRVGSDKTLLIDSKDLNNISDHKATYKVDVILDITGLIKTKKILSFFEFGGKYIILGFMHNNFFKIPTNYILIKGLKIFGIRAGEYLKNSNKKKKIIRNIINIMKKDSIKEKYYRLHPFKDLISVLKKLEDRSSIGKNIVITKYYKKEDL